MSNIIGNPFDDFVKNQIKVRQSALGDTSRISPDNLKYYTTKTPWLRLASSVDLTGTEGDGGVLDRLAESIPRTLISNNNLAKNFILQGGSLSLIEEEDDEGNIISSKIKLQKGLNYSNDIFNGAYGWGGLNSTNGGRGYVPMPGIESAQSTYFNDGALSKTTIKIKCFSKAQFQLLDALYLRPGYSLLLEFGWSTFLNSNSDTNFDGEINENDAEIGALHTFDGFKSAPLSFLLKPSSFLGDQNQFQMLQLISEERLKFSGNYDAVYGKISSFKWSFGKDGSYSCDITLIGLGNIMESLKLNVTDPKKGNFGEDELAKIKTVTKKRFIYDFWGDLAWYVLGIPIRGRALSVSDLPGPKQKQFFALVLNKPNAPTLSSTKEELDAFIDPLWKDEVERQKQRVIDNNNSNPILSNKDDTKLNKIFYDINQQIMHYANLTNYDSFFHNVQGIENGSFLLNNTYIGELAIKGGNKTSKSIYIKFGALLKIIEDNCNLFSKKADGTPMIKFDFVYSNLSNDQNYMLIIPPNISSDPGKCLVPHNVMGFKDIIDYTISETDLPTDSSLNSELIQKQGFVVEDQPFAGRLGNVLINLRFASSAISESPKDSDGAISVLSFVKTILQGITESMGSINDFFTTYDENDGRIKIYDKSPIPNINATIPEEFSKFNIFGVKQNQGSFITNIGLDAEIPENFASIVTIGAQASGNNLMGNSLSFQNYNQGLIDRIIPEKLDYDALEKNNPDELVKKTPLEQAKELKNDHLYYPIKDGVASPIGSMYLQEGGYGAGSSGNLGYNFTPSLIKDLTENYTSYMQLISGILSENNQIPAPFFLPFNLNLEMEGLSGMKLFEKFKITDEILPPSYEKDTIDIIIKGINHEINTLTWKTTIDTLSVPNFSTTSITGSVSTPIPSNKRQEKLKDEEDEDDLNDFERFVVNTPWSAAFISYVMVQAGIKFPASSAHTGYAQQIRTNLLNFASNLGGSPPYNWKTLPPTNPLKIGDIIIKNRSTNTGTKEEPNFVKNTMTYQTSPWVGASHGDVVVDIKSVGTNAFADIIGGNVRDTVTKKKLTLNLNKTLKNQKGFFVILRPGELASNIASVAIKENLFWRNRKELNPDIFIKQKLHDYYTLCPELNFQVPNVPPSAPSL